MVLSSRRTRKRLGIVVVLCLSLVLAAVGVTSGPVPVARADSRTCGSDPAKPSTPNAVCGSQVLATDAQDPGSVALPAGAVPCPASAKSSSAAASCQAGTSSAETGVQASSQPTIALPSGAKACQSAGGKRTSSPGAACGSETAAGGPGETTASSLPPGQSACPATASKPSSASASCAGARTAGARTAATLTGTTYTISLSANPTAVAPGASSTLTAYASVDVGPTPWWIEIFDRNTGQNVGYCSSGSSCSTSVSQSSPTTHGFVAYIASLGTSNPPPNVQATSNTVNVTWLSISLRTSAAYVAAGRSATLTATANTDVGPTPWYIEIFNRASGQSVAICATGSSCSTSVTYNGPTSQSYVAYVSAYGTSNPPPAVQATSGSVTVTWVTLGLSASPLYLAPGAYTTLTATASLDVGPTPYWIEIFDSSSGANVAVCASGSSCSVSLTHSSATTRTYVAYVSGFGLSNPPPSVVVTSNTVNVTWFSVRLSASRTSLVWSSPSTLTATANADVGPSPYYLEIFDQTDGLNLVICGRGSSCSGSVSVSNAVTHSLVAYVSLYGTSNPPPSVQATSNVVTVTWFLWGVDTINAVNQPCNYPAATCYQAVLQAFGLPDFFGRYIGTGAFDMTHSEVSYAHSVGLAIMPIYSDFLQGTTTGSTNGVNYANDAANAARNLGIPSGVVIYIDIEPGAAIDSAFIQAWVDTAAQRGYQGGFYENPGGNFGGAYCSAGRNAQLDSFEPSGGGTSRNASPSFSPFRPGCANQTNVWQYAINIGSPNIDDDEALGSAPLWHP